MKKTIFRFVAILICASSLLAITSCSRLETYQEGETKTKQETADEAKATVTEEELEKVLLVPDPLTWEKINAIPVATSDMTNSQLRQICLDYFRLQLSFQWTPSETFRYVIESYERNVDIKQGEMYMGSPYDGGQGNLYKIMNNYDPETGILTVSKKGEHTTSYIGNHCSSSSHWAWSRISNTIRFTLTESITEANGAIKLGSYKYENEGKKHISTRDVCKANGEQVMFQSYALLQPADGVICFNGAGHVMMASAKAHVQHLPNGQIDGENSYVLVMEQVSSWEDVAVGNETLSRQGRIDNKYTFNDLFKSSYLPFTIKELIGQDPVEKAEVKLEPDGEVSSMDQLRKQTLVSNYEISDITVRVLSPEGKAVYTYTANCDWVTFQKKLNQIIFPGSISPFAKKGDHRLEVLCRVGTGELLTVYSENLT